MNMMNQGELLALDRRHVWHPFTQELTASAPIPMVRAHAASLYSQDGQEYLDMISSWWVINHGHTHPMIAAAIAQQAATLEQVIFAGCTHPKAVELAVTLANHLPQGLERVFFSDNGSTAVEIALKMARQFWHNQGKTRNRFLAFAGGYHGETVGAMSASRSTGFFAAFESMLFPVDMLPYPATWEQDDALESKEAEALAALEAYLERYGDSCAAVILEPLIQGASGMRMCRPEFLQKFCHLVRQAHILIIFDEVMTGFGRSGTLFALEQVGITPDLLALSKGLTGGFMPLAVTVCQPHVYEAFLGQTFSTALAHGHSFTANPLGCAAALASLNLFTTENTMARVVAIEAIHRERLGGLQGSTKVLHGRVQGSVAALEIRGIDPHYGSDRGGWLKNFFLKRAILIRPLGNVFYLLPPFCTSAQQLHRAWDVLEEALESGL
ncbi:MAG: adenosylmethionine--8-amino-7-oxononanoate transaminase [Magnetococcus sp. DMHC-6]